MGALDLRWSRGGGAASEAVAGEVIDVEIAWSDGCHLPAPRSIRLRPPGRNGSRPAGGAEREGSRRVHGLDGADRPPTGPAEAASRGGPAYGRQAIRTAGDARPGVAPTQRASPAPGRHGLLLLRRDEQGRQLSGTVPKNDQVWRTVRSTLACSGRCQREARSRPGSPPDAATRATAGDEPTGGLSVISADQPAHQADATSSEPFDNATHLPRRRLCGRNAASSRCRS